MSLLEAVNLSVEFAVPGDRRCRLRAVDEVSLAIAAGESVGLVGESGSGKSTLGRALLGLESAATGRVLFEGRDLAHLRGAALTAFRRSVQMIFQDPMGSLNPRLTIGAALEEVLAVHRVVAAGERAARVAELLRMVGLASAHRHRYPHEFSGGQRQRVGIARALAVAPRLLIADEPVSALDVSVQAQILELLQSLRASQGLTYLFIAHDLAVVNSMCERVLVIYRGRIVEAGGTEEVFFAPAHPYTAALRAAVPDPDMVMLPQAGAARSVPALHGAEDPPEEEPSRGCAFQRRCPFVQARCREEIPATVVLESGHWSRCWRTEELRERLRVY